MSGKAKGDDMSGKNVNTFSSVTAKNVGVVSVIQKYLRKTFFFGAVQENDQHFSIWCLVTE